MIGLVIVVLLLLGAIFAPLLAPHAPLLQARDAVLQPPSGMFPLGTDDVGRDVLARVLYGARLSLAVGGVVVSVALVAGTLLGLWPGSRTDLAMR